MKKWLLLKNIKERVQKPYPIYDQNGRNQLKSIPYLWPKRLKNPTLWDRTYLYSPYKGVPPPRHHVYMYMYLNGCSWHNVHHITDLQILISLDDRHLLFTDTGTSAIICKCTLFLLTANEQPAYMYFDSVNHMYFWSPSDCEWITKILTMSAKLTFLDSLLMPLRNSPRTASHLHNNRHYVGLYI